MSNRIFKYQLRKPEYSIDMPKGAKIIHVDLQHNVPCIWAIVDNRYAKEPRHFKIIETGNFVPDGGNYIGTYFVDGGSFVFHVFEVFPRRAHGANS